MPAPFRLFRSLAPPRRSLFHGGAVRVSVSLVRSLCCTKAARGGVLPRRRVLRGGCYLLPLPRFFLTSSLRRARPRVRAPGSRNLFLGRSSGRASRQSPPRLAALKGEIHGCFDAHSDPPFSKAASPHNTARETSAVSFAELHWRPRSRQACQTRPYSLAENR